MKITRELLAASWRSWYSNDLRTVGPGWLQLVWTFFFSCAVGCGFFVLGLAFSVMGSGRWPGAAALLRWLGINLTVGLTIGFTIHALFALLTRLIGADRIRAFDNPRKGLFFGGVPLLGTAIGWPLGAWIVSGQAGAWFPFGRPGAVAGALLIAALISVVLYLHFDAKTRQIEAERRATEAQLRLLQGQIEPHFLFNTLANVLALMDHEPPKARAMLESFVDYLRASLGALRRDEAPLERELALAEAYLRLLGTRMEERLRYSIEADDAARRVSVPPLLLQPLVENAIRHGLEPKIDGGRIDVQARVVDGRTLVLQVRDDGLGTPAAPAGRAAGNGVALANIRERLRSLYGDEASLELRPAHPGTCATLRLPLPAATAA
jgi:two-component sensor histidine kinase